MNTIIKEKEIVTKQIIEHINYNDIFSLYKIKMVTGEQTSYRYGLCFNSEITELEKNPEIFISKAKNFNLWKKETPDVIRTDYHFFQKEYSKHKIQIDDIFDKIETLNDFSDYIILKYESDNELLFEYQKDIPLPKSIYFDYITGNMSNEYHNLEECLTLLKNRTDIEIFTDKHGYGRLIQDVPYYNQNEEGNRRYIEFVWKPTQQDWEKLYTECFKTNPYNRYEYIKKNILNLPYTT